MIGRIISIRTMHFSRTEFDALQSLRKRYKTAHHLFTQRELAHLRFRHWLVRSPGWDRAMDQPYETRARAVPTQETGTWMPGFIG
jgi:hypothetical protein